MWPPGVSTTGRGQLLASGHPGPSARLTFSTAGGTAPRGTLSRAPVPVVTPTPPSRRRRRRRPGPRPDLLPSPRSSGLIPPWPPPASPPSRCDSGQLRTARGQPRHGHPGGRRRGGGLQQAGTHARPPGLAQAPEAPVAAAAAPHPHPAALPLRPRQPRPCPERAARAEDHAALVAHLVPAAVGKRGLAWGRPDGRGTWWAGPGKGSRCAGSSVGVTLWWAWHRVGGAWGIGWAGASGGRGQVRVRGGQGPVWA